MKEQNQQNKKRIKPDVIVISAIVFIVILLLFFTFIFQKQGTVAVVEVNGVIVGEYSLSQNGIFVLNNGTNTLVIENGEAYLRDSHCPDHTCERTGKIQYVGQTIVCLPNRLSVTVKGNANNGVDLVS